VAFGVVVVCGILALMSTATRVLKSIVD